MNATAKREEELFDAALRLASAAERELYLGEACGDDVELKRRVEALLQSSGEAEAFFEDGSAAVNSAEVLEQMSKDPDDEESVGVRIGRYRLLQRLGDGGCGVVYLAEQEEPVRRAVALKIIRLGMETKRVISRFEAERQALAMMDHPNIARVFDAGATRNGSPYFVMEHVRGARITEYCAEHRLGVAERLELFVQVCHAIQHAHQKGIIHGDIKPSNIIVSQHDGVPLPRVIDFGIARATEAGLSEMMPVASPGHQVLGTPAYMSPEQVELGGLDVDTRSDIYSLGVLLYELLTGHTPFERERLATVGLAELRRILGRELPPRPSERIQSMGIEEQKTLAAAMGLTPRALLNALRGDLDCIVMRALEKDRRRRYETADSLVMDIKRFKKEEPVTAHPPSWFYIFKKSVRRNRVAVVASGAVALALLFGIGFSTLLLVREREARQRAVAAEQRQARLRFEAESRERLTQAAFLVSQERFAEADLMLADVTLNDATMEGAAVFRSLGEWHALNARWKQAVDRFEVLLSVNQLEGADVSSLDYLELGPALIELNDLAGYDRFRLGAIDRFKGTNSPFSDRIVKICLLAPANSRLIGMLAPFATDTEKAAAAAEAAGDYFQAAWRTMSIALYEYRRGDLVRAAELSRHCLASPDNNAPRAVAARSILAMALVGSGRINEAQAELATAREITQTRFRGNTNRGNPVQGFWFDWAFARILEREAQRLLDDAL